VTPDDVEKLELVVKDDAKDPLTQKPRHYTVRGLPSHLQADIDGTDQQGYRYRLARGFDKYEPKQSSRTPEDAFAELKRLLNWDAPLGLVRR
jgi:hypothetical protein